jgi:hypothetical protein
VLVAVSAAQLAAGGTGMALALARRHPYDVPLLHGRPDAVSRDSLLMGTALSAPVSMLATQLVATVRLARGDNRPATTTLTGLGGLMVAGYLAERLVRRRLRPSGWDAVETPVIVAGLSLAAAMTALGARSLAS